MRSFPRRFLTSARNFKRKKSKKLKFLLTKPAQEGEDKFLSCDTAQLLALLKKTCKLIIISAADAQSCVDEDIGYIVVTCADTAAL